MFGPLQLDLAGDRRGPRDLGGVKPKQLLEILLLERERMVPKDRLADVLWGERLPQRVTATIESYVSVLRRALDDGSGLARRLIVTDRGGYWLAADLADVDLDRFDRLIRKSAGGGPTQRRVALEAATAMADAELLADEPYAEWVLPQREHYHSRQIQALIDLAECCLELEDHPAALGAADRVLTREPVNERAYRVAMLAQYALGARDEALRLHTRCRAALAEELGVSPTPQMAELHLAILRDEDPATLLRRPTERPPASLGNLRAALPVAFANSDGTRIAHQVVGEGPVDIVFVPSFVSNLGATWDDPTYAAFLRQLASMARLILFDNRGTGLSDPALDFPTTRRRSDDLASVLDAVGSERAVVFGVCAGGALCGQFAVDHPDRTQGLILHNSYARMLRTEDYPWGWPVDRYERFLERFEEVWLNPEDGVGRRNPGLAENSRYKVWFGRYLRLAASPWMARRLAELNAEIDFRPLLADIQAPCLVTCTTEDVWFSPENSRYLAQNIPGAQLVELPGVNHYPWGGDTAPVLEAVEEFVGALGRVAPAPARADVET